MSPDPQPPPPPAVQAKCPACEHPNPPWRGTCEKCGVNLEPSEPDSDPTWPAPDEPPGDAGKPGLVAPDRIERLRRVVRGLEVTLRLDGNKLMMSIELQPGRAMRGDLPMEVGVKVFNPTTKFFGPPDAWVTLARAANAVRCTLPARGLTPGDAAVVALSWADTREEIQTLVQ